jgi:rhodanese-related sulfurtransferase
MRVRHPLAQIAIFVAASFVIAVVANGFASRTRKLILPGYYPDALRVPKPVAAAVPVPPPAPVTATVAPPEPSTAGFQPAPTSTQSRLEASGTPTPAPRTPAPAPRIDVSRFTPHPDKPYVELGGDEVAALYESGALFLDARRSSVFEDGHIAGARSFSVWESDIDDKVNALFEERPNPEDQNKPIVIYCSGGACEDSHMLAQKLFGLLFNNVYVYKDGFPDWQKRGLPTRSGSTP